MGSALVGRKHLLPVHRTLTPTLPSQERWGRESGIPLHGAAPGGGQVGVCARWEKTSPASSQTLTPTLSQPRALGEGVWNPSPRRCAGGRPGGGLRSLGENISCQFTDPHPNPLPAKSTGGGSFLKGLDYPGYTCHQGQQQAAGDDAAQLSGGIRAHGMHQDEIVVIFIQSHPGGKPAGHREGADPAGPDERVDLAAGDKAHQFAEQQTGHRIDHESQQAQHQDHPGFAG